MRELKVGDVYLYRFDCDRYLIEKVIYMGKTKYWKLCRSVVLYSSFDCAQVGTTSGLDSILDVEEFLPVYNTPLYKLMESKK